MKKLLGLITLFSLCLFTSQAQYTNLGDVSVGKIKVSGTKITGISTDSALTAKTASTTVPTVEAIKAYISHRNVDGTWTGDPVAGLYGGTGVANSGKTITLAGNLTLAGAYALTLTQTAATNVTLPTTGTLVTRAGTETLTNKTLTTAAIGTATITTWYISALSTAPSAANDTGTTGEIRFGASYIYLCVATDTWKRVAIATW